jgi:hypothetical protein
MSTDSEILFSDSDKDGERGGDFVSMITDNFSKIPWKIAVFLFIIYIIINSDIFMNSVLKRFDGVSELGVTQKGIFISGLFMAMSYVVLDFCNNMNYI